MKILINKRLGNSTMQIEIDERQEKEALLKACFFLSPDSCGACRSTNVIWEGRRAKGDTGTFIYVSRRCVDCNAQSTAGEFKDGGLFWKAWGHYQRDEDAQESISPRRSENGVRG
ncbi:MAG: hypothetical protein ACREO5_00820 [Candidatus Binatia bacterium]